MSRSGVQKSFLLVRRDTSVPAIVLELLLHERLVAAPERRSVEILALGRAGESLRRAPSAAPFVYLTLTRRAFDQSVLHGLWGVQSSPMTTPETSTQ